MSFKIIYSRAFLEKISSWSEPLRQMAFQAAQHAAIDPTLHDYVRQYSKPYLQKHPTADGQYSLYFKIVSQNEIFVAWINDRSCLHDTRANFPDPCRKEFERLRDRGELEQFDPGFHVFQIEVNPDRLKPIRCRSKFLGYEVIVNSFKVDASDFVGHAFFCDEPIPMIARNHVRLFLVELYKTLKSGKMNFEFRFTHAGHQVEIGLLRSSLDPTQWTDISDAEDFVLKLV